MRTNGTRVRAGILAGILGASLSLVISAPAAQGDQELRLSAVPASAAVSADKRGRTKLRLDDGQQDFVVALTDGEHARTVQAVVLNRFSPSTNRLPLALDTVMILFPKTCQAGDTGLRAGMAFEVLVYVDASGSGDPANAMLVARQPIEIEPSDSKFQ